MWENVRNASISNGNYALFSPRTSRKSDESLEMQPLHNTSPRGSKILLKRMSRVRSDEKDADSAEAKDELHDKTPSPIGAGLPLLQRLRLLKEKQVSWPGQGLEAIPVASTSPPTCGQKPHSHSHSYNHRVTGNHTALLVFCYFSFHFHFFHSPTSPFARLGFPHPSRVTKSHAHAHAHTSPLPHPHATHKALNGFSPQADKQSVE